MIAQIIRESSIDYPGKFGPLVFTAGCNFRCSFCHNAGLNNANEFLDEDKIIKDIQTKVKKGWYNGITISGGEPTLHAGLENFIRKLKKLGLSVKLDSNGTNPEILKKLLDEKLVDYVAMDIKGPKEIYSDITNVKFDIKKIEESIRILSSLSPLMFEFRTTVPFIFENEKPRVMNEKETEEMAVWMQKLNGGKARWFVQGFISRGEDDMNDVRLSVDNLPKEMQKTPEDYLEKIKNIIASFGFDVRVR